MRERDFFAFGFGFFWKRYAQVFKRTIVPFRIDHGRQTTPAPSGKMRRHIEWNDAHDADDGAQQQIFEPELQIAERRSGDGRGQKSVSLCDIG